MTGWLLETATAVTILLAAVLLLRGLVARLFGAGWAYALWLIPALRLVLPPLPQLSEALPPVVIFIPATGGGTGTLASDASSGLWLPFMIAAWGGGAIIFLTLQWLSYRDFVSRLDARSRRARPPEYGGIATWVSELVDGPLALGLLRRRIVVPSDFSRRYAEGERRLAMEHELGHHRRGDLWWTMAAILFLALNWFNPLAWIAFRAFRADQELACDAAITAGATPEERHQYALAMVKSAARPGLIAACSMNGAGELKRRLRMMRSHRRSRARSAGGMAAVAILGTAGLSLAAATADPQPNFVYLPVDAASPSPAPKLLAAAAGTEEILVTGHRANLLRAAARRPAERAHRAAASVPDQRAMTLAALESGLEPLPLQSVRLPQPLRVLPAALRSRAAPVAAPAAYSHSYVLRTSTGAEIRSTVSLPIDPGARDKVRAAIAEAIKHADGDVRIELRRVEQVLAGPYTATLVEDHEWKG